MATPLDKTERHYHTVLRALCDGRVVPFLGAGANLCDRPPGAHWTEGGYLPSGGELSEYLADYFNYQSNDAAESCPACRSEVNLTSARERRDLARVSQYVALDSGLGPLYEQLRNVFVRPGNYPQTSLHRFFAALPSALRAKGYPRTIEPLRRRLTLVTTNYDDVLEDAFREAGESFHVISYVADSAVREQCGKCLHWPPGGAACLIESPNDYDGLLNDDHPVIVKIHGAIDRDDQEHDSFVITEDHYIDYLTRANISNLLPAPLPAVLRRSHFLFLGYSLRDLNLRVILHLIQRDRKLNYKSWAIQVNPQELDEKFWGERNVEILDLRLERYIAALDALVKSL